MDAWFLPNFSAKNLLGRYFSASTILILLFFSLIDIYIWMQNYKKIHIIIVYNENYKFQKEKYLNSKF